MDDDKADNADNFAIRAGVSALRQLKLADPEPFERYKEALEKLNAGIKAMREYYEWRHSREDDQADQSKEECAEERARIRAEEIDAELNTDWLSIAELWTLVEAIEALYLSPSPSLEKA